MNLDDVDIYDKSSMTDNALTPPDSSTFAAAIPVKTMESSDAADSREPSEQPRSVAELRRRRVPPTNGNGHFYCNHNECAGKVVTFKQRCNWDKHMDRHERPYRCDHRNCRNAQGFTYGGGLLRHRREVHGMNLTSASRLFCPFPNCPRSSGASFTRRENLEEHKRRRHVGEEPPNVEAKGPSRKKRRHSPPPSEQSDVRAAAEITEHDDAIEPGPGANPVADNYSEMAIEDHPMVLQLQRELKMIRQENNDLRAQLTYCFNALSSVPQQFYRVNPAPHHQHGLAPPQPGSLQYYGPGN